MSEFSYYSFRSDHDLASEKGNRPSFEEWLEQRHPNLEIVLYEHPTYDTKPVDVDTLTAVKEEIFTLLSAGRTVVVVDSGGVGRTGRVVKYLGAIEIPLSLWEPS